MPGRGVTPEKLKPMGGEAQGTRADAHRRGFSGGAPRPASARGERCRLLGAVDDGARLRVDRRRARPASHADGDRALGHAVARR